MNRFAAPFSEGTEHKRILVIGCPGSGKSTLAVKLSKRTGLPVVHLDKLFWTGEWKERSDEEFCALLDNEMRKPEWIIDGNYNSTLKHRLDNCDTVIYLDFPRIKCLLGVLKRIRMYRGSIRPDMGGECRERFDMDFLGYVFRFNGKYRKKYHALLSDSAGIDIFILKNRRQADETIDRIASISPKDQIQV